MKSKIRGYVYYVLGVIILFSGCAPKRETETKGVELEVFFSAPATFVPFFQRVYDGFRQEHPQIKVKLQNVPSGDRWNTNYYSKLMTRIASGTPPDVIYLHPGKITPFAEKETLLDLTPFLNKDKEIGLDNFHPQAVKPYIYQGKVYGLPHDLNVWVIYYNKNLFDEAKAPYPIDDWTWDDLIRTAKAMTKIDRNGKIEQYGILNYNVFSAIWQAGGRIVDNDENPRRCLLDSPEAIEGLQFCLDLTFKYHVAPRPAQIETLGGLNAFMTGKVAMFSMGTPVIAELRKSVKNFQWDVVSLPKGKKKATYLEGISVAISAQTKHPEESWKLVKYLVSPNAQSILVKTGWPVPSRKELTPLYLSGHPPDNTKAIINDIAYGHLWPKLKRWPEAWSIITDEIDLAYMRKKSASEALHSAAFKVNKLLEEGGKEQ